MFSSQQSQVSSDTLYVEDVFSAFTYTGNGSTQTITNGIDLAGNGGLVWTKHRNAANYHYLCDTARTRAKGLFSNDTGAEQTSIAGRDIASFDSTGYTLGQDYAYTANSNAQTFISWTFRKAAKFFDVVTYTGNGAGSKTLNHSLGIVPGTIIVKKTSAAGDWRVWHRSVGDSQTLVLNTTAASTGTGVYWGTPTATQFGVGGPAFGDISNDSGATYVAYLFAHDTATDGLIQCGSFTTDGSGNATVTLGWEPQFLMWKASSNTSNWQTVDEMRGLPVSGNTARLFPNTSDAENTSSAIIGKTATGFQLTTAVSTTYVYLAIRRGPMKAPTSGTQVYNAIARTGTGAAATVTGVGFPPDLVIGCDRGKTTSVHTVFTDRLRGSSGALLSNTTNAELTYTDAVTAFGMDGLSLGADGTQGAFNVNTKSYIEWLLRRYPGVFDQVCYTGTGSATTVSHNLGVVPDLMIFKGRSGATGWRIFSPAGTAAQALDFSTAALASNGTYLNGTSPTSSVFTVGGAGGGTNDSAATYTAYLFATMAGISKVGSYTGTGTTLQVDCGFAAGARFVLIKRTNSTGDWYVWDSTRGIIAGNDPFLLINSTAAENTATDYIDPLASGFEISSTAPAAINASGGTFIYLAFA